MYLCKKYVKNHQNINKEKEHKKPTKTGTSNVGFNFLQTKKTKIFNENLIILDNRTTDSIFL